MPAWAWVLIALGVIVVLGVLAFLAWSRQRTTRLRGRFGSEYDRTLETSKSRRAAETELAAREERHEQLQVRPLTETARERYQTEWRSVQAEFVDRPEAAVADADALIQSVMAERGYPVEDFEQRAADVSVDHADVVEHYRAGHRLARSAGDGNGSTEDLRQAMRHYRALFEELLEPDAAPAEAATANERRERVTR